MKIFSPNISVQTSNPLSDWSSDCEDPIEGFEVSFTHSWTPQNPEWSPLIYIAAHTLDNGDPVPEYQIEEILTLHINTTRGNPIEYEIDWVNGTGLAPFGSMLNTTETNVTIDGND